MPRLIETMNRVVRVNDGNDSNVDTDNVIDSTIQFQMKFYNSSNPSAIKNIGKPIVLTINPGRMTDEQIHKVEPEDNLIYVRFRANTWNIELMQEAVDYYSVCEVPIVLTFMAYFNTSIPDDHQKYYTYRKRTLNSYHAGWEMIMSMNKYNKWVYSCGKIEGELGTTACRHCGNCLREYFATIERMR